MADWNPWHGCKKVSAGCVNCYVYRMDSRHDKDSSVVTKTHNFNLPIKKNRLREYKIPSGEMVWTCFTSDFLIDEADEWRDEAWSIMKERSDLNFLFITKRIERFQEVIPPDWGYGYDNVTIGCTCENQEMADKRLPIFLSAPIKHRIIICEPLLTPIDLTNYLSDKVDEVVVGGESGSQARTCDFDWVVNIMEQCRKEKINFTFRQTGANFRKNDKIYKIERKYQFSQAKKANLNLRFK